MQNTKRANTMTTITDDLTVQVKNKFTSSNAEKTIWIHLTTDVRHLLTDVKFSHQGVIVVAVALRTTQLGWEQTRGGHMNDALSHSTWGIPEL